MTIISASKQSLPDKEKVLQFGRGNRFVYDKDATVVSIIEKQVKEKPDNIAIRFQRKVLTYRQLNEQVNQLAHYLVRKGIEPHSNVAIYLEPSLECIISILAVLKIGGCYVPLDTNYPIERLNFMLEDSSCTLLLTQSNLIHKLNDTNINLIAIDRCITEIKKEKSINLNSLVTAANLAYIIYTSGSTGTPKGIAIHHRAINNHMGWMKNHFCFNPLDIILLKTPLSFDPSVWEIFLPFYVGAQLIVAPAGSYLSPEQLIKLINRYHVTTIQFVPSLLHEFLKQKKVTSCHSLRSIFSGGESLRADTKKMFFDKLHCQLHNLYGPTEATIEIASHTLTPSTLDINTNIIGKPISNTQLYVLDPAMNLVKIGEEGELYIGGDSLSKGYYNNPKETKEKFVDNPFDYHENAKLYRTGDIVKWLESGDLVYIGRNNDQIKINGVRIEPNELVSYILNNHQISNCIITKKVNPNNCVFLACHIVPKDDIDPNIPAIKNSLKNFFPRYMLPKSYTIIKSIPLTINGKLDVSALSDPYIQISHQESILEQTSDEKEQKLLMIWKKLLKSDHVTLKDNFFEIGGCSILAFQLLIHIKSQLRVSMHIKDIFLYPTVTEQIKRIAKLKKKRTSKKMQMSLENSIIPLQTKGNKTPLFLIHPIGGTVFWYSILANLLGSSRPIYAIQDPAIELKKKVFHSIAEMAESYVSMIQKIQSTGPYLIGGASFGSTVAIEIANQLQKKNEKIDIVCILDGWAVYPNTLRNDNYFKESMRRQHADLKTEFVKYNLPEPEDLFAIQWHRLSLLWDYRLTEINCPIALFKSKEILPAFKEVDAQLNHWEKFTQQTIKAYSVPGNHETMFQTPYVHRLANFLNQCLDGIERKKVSIQYP